MSFLNNLAARYLSPERRNRRSGRKDRAHKQKGVRGGADVWATSEDFLRAQSRGIHGIPDDRCFTLQSAMRSLYATEGDVAECGVRLGKSSVFLLEADRRPRIYRLFDSFEGLSEPSEEDVLAGSGQPYWRKGDIAVSEAQARANLAGYSNVRFYRGWIPDRFAEVADCRFALLHVDVDLYKPTYDSLAFFWPRLVGGGVVVCDDYGSRKCPGARRALDEFFAGKPVSFFELTTGQALVVKNADSLGREPA